MELKQIMGMLCRAGRPQLMMESVRVLATMKPDLKWITLSALRSVFKLLLYMAGRFPGQITYEIE